ncbi:hypothetical protein SLEP1_g14215 [Rubroshorea leprosula]|uniref:Reverse transcriptase domain-containing protein n=1 Tax=Rubroshorea leprosula TaxID=152421 RepID=A0AAV5IPB9_9ROSI|nr:hypothetical protein SLEP1_g14215 [Rubroshorea leprosula]
MKDSRQEQIEEERSTQPFWEGLASDNEILQSRVERFARERKRKKQMERQMKIIAKAKRCRRKKGRNQTTPLQEISTGRVTYNLQQKRANSEMDPGTNCWREAEELWSVGKQLGLVSSINAEDIIERLVKMEKRDRAELANQKLAEAAKKGKEESKLEVCDERVLKAIWGGDNFKWVAKPAQGRSGGIICIWCPGKRVLWRELIDLMTTCGEGNWCIAGDFNAIRSREEKKGRCFDEGAMREFSNFICEAGLKDMPLIGRKFTWYKADGTAMSRLDRFLVSTDFLINFPELTQKGLMRDLSDHSPIMLVNSSKDWGPRPFRSLDCWMEHKEFKAFIQEKWNNYIINGWGGFRLKEKLKRLKNDLKKWNREVFGHVDKKIEEARIEIKRLDVKVDSTYLTEIEIEKRKACFQEVWEWSRARDSILFQKSRQKWLQEGDANSKYFHGCIIRKRKQNGLIGIRKNNEWIEDVPEVKGFIKEYFERKFDEEEWDRPDIELKNLNQLCTKENNSLISEFSEEEIYEAIQCCNGNKSPSPDGFNFAFIKNMWPILKEDIVAFAKEFWANGKLVKRSNASFIVLFPKKENPQGLGEFRPISLIGCMYKIISKILANRLSKVLPSIINLNQSAFIGGRQIANGIVVANEVIHEAKRRKRSTLIFKADFEKAYDSVNWEFFNRMMEKFGFCRKWRMWIRECLSTATVSVLVNGSPTEEFHMKKGLRQGDPLAPFLFLLVAEALNGLILKAKEENLYKGTVVGAEEMEITHLQFADDSIFFCEASEQNVQTIKCVLRCFELISGLKVNYFKSALYGISVETQKVNEWAEKLNCVRGVMPFKYLGIPVGANSRRISTWMPVVDCLRRKLSSWKCESLSFGGRIILLNAVLSSIPVYFFSTLRAPKKVLKLLSLIQRRFMWGGAEDKRTIAWVRWDQVCKSRKMGGLGVKDLNSFNLALLGKWRWRLLWERDALWNRVVEAKYQVHKKRDYEGEDVKASSSEWWKAIWRLDREIVSKEGWIQTGLEKVLGEGNDTSFCERFGGMEGGTVGVEVEVE